MSQKTRPQPPLFFQSVLYGNPDYYPPMIRGSVVLDRDGIQQEILCRDFSSKLLPDISVTYPPSTHVMRIKTHSSASQLSYFEFVFQVLRLGNPRSQFFIGYDMLGFLPAKLLAMRYRRPLVYHSHDYVENSRTITLFQRMVKLFEQKTAPTTDLVIVPDAHRADFMAQELKLRQLPLVVANAALDQPDKSSNILREKLLERGKQFQQIVFRQGYIGEHHGIEQTIRSLPFWSNSQWGFVLIGPGEESYKQYLRTLAEENGVSNQFDILPPVNSYTELFCYTGGANIGHGLYEPSHVNHKFIAAASNKTMEYMAAGLPILLTDTPGSRAIIEKYHNGVLVQVENPASIAHGINTILENPTLAHQMGEGSTQAFQEEFNYTHQYAPAIAKFLEMAHH